MDVGGNLNQFRLEFGHTGQISVHQALGIAAVVGDVQDICHTFEGGLLAEPQLAHTMSGLG